MNLKQKNTIQTTWTMSSMTDIIFLLLIFFMLTASFVTPSGLPVNLPTSSSSTIVMQKVSVTITKRLQYYVNEKKVSQGNLKAALQGALQGKQGVVVLHIDKSVPTEHLVRVAGIATSLEARVSIATQPETN